MSKGEVILNPCFLYESVWCLLGVLTLHILSKKKTFNGQVALGYCIWYGLGRSVIEGLRTDSLYIGNTSIRVSQALSLCLVVLGIAVTVAVLLIMKKRNNKTQNICEAEDGTNN